MADQHRGRGQYGGGRISDLGAQKGESWRGRKGESLGVLGAAIESWKR